MRINTNIAALNAWRNLGVTDSSMSKSLERLSSGYRINKAADDAAGLAISEKMRSQISGLRSAMSNAQNGISLIQTAEGALQETHSILQRMRELAVQAANDTMTDADRAELNKEVENLLTEINRIATDTEFNTKKLLNGNLAEATTKQGTILKSVSLELAAGSAAAGATTLESLYDADGNSFGFASGTAATITVTFYKGESFASTTVTVSGGQTLASLAAEVETQMEAAGVNGSLEVTITAAGGMAIEGADGLDEHLSHVKFSAANKVLFNDKFSAFEETQAAQNAQEDKSVGLQIGANSGQTMTLGVNEMTKTALRISSLDISTKQGAKTALTLVDNAISTVSSERSNLGAAQNRLEHTIQNLSVAAENLQAAESRIRDVDMALEMTSFTRQQILLQAGTAMLAQSNQKPQTVLSLLR